MSPRARQLAINRCSTLDDSTVRSRPCTDARRRAGAADSSVCKSVSNRIRRAAILIVSLLWASVAAAQAPALESAIPRIQRVGRPLGKRVYW